MEKQVLKRQRVYVKKGPAGPNEALFAFRKRMGEQIYLLRQKKGLTQRDLAIKLDTSDNNIAHWEAGRSMPQGRLLYNFCLEMEVELMFMPVEK